MQNVSLYGITFTAILILIFINKFKILPASKCAIYSTMCRGSAMAAVSTFKIVVMAETSSH